MNGLNKPRFAAGEVHSTVNVTILTHLKTHGPSHVATLGLALVNIDGHCDDAEFTKLRRALSKLRQKRLVHKLDEDDSDVWASGPRPTGEGGGTGVPAAPRQVNVMHGDPWKPGPAPVLRAGALDFKLHRSHGHLC